VCGDHEGFWGREVEMTASGSDVFDRASLLTRLAGDEELVREIVTLFVEDTASLVVQLRKAAAAEDLSVVAQIAHAMRGAAANVSASRMVDVAQRTERAAKQGSVAESVDNAAELAAELAAFRSAAEAMGVIPPRRDPPDPPD
jgi:HPt (histidine-containing phosphotransfer) domain-containing protein